MSFLPLDGPAQQLVVSVSTAAITEAKAGVSALEERKVVTIQPLNGKVYVYFAQEGVTPSAATVIANGFIQYKNQKETYEASNSQLIYLVAVSATTNVSIAERA
jgi:uncharacterized protein YpmB